MEELSLSCDREFFFQMYVVSGREFKALENQSCGWIVKIFTKPLYEHLKVLTKRLLRTALRWERIWWDMEALRSFDWDYASIPRFKYILLYREWMSAEKKSHLWVDEEKYFHIKSPPFLLSEYHGREWGGEGVVEKADDVGGVRWICVWCCMGHTERRSGRERRRKNKLIDIRNVYYFKVLFPPSHIPVQLWVSALLLPLLCLFFPSSTACLLCRVPSFDGDCTFMFLFQCFCCRFCFFFSGRNPSLKVRIHRLDAGRCTRWR